MSSTEVDAALAAGVAERAQRLLGIEEDQWFDRKSIRLRSRDLAPHLVAFANAEGGTLVIGLSRGTAEDVDARGDQLNELRQSSIDFTDPPVRMTCEAVDVVSAGEPNHLLIVRVAPGERVHRTKSGECYLRIGDKSRKLTFTQERELLYDRGQTQYDGEAAHGVTHEDLNDDLLHQFGDVVGIQGYDRLLQARSLVTRAGELTHAAYLLFGRRPQDMPAGSGQDHPLPSERSRLGLNSEHRG